MFIRFQNILWIVYFFLALLSYPYLKKSYFPQKPSKFDKFMIMILAIFWIVSVPVTAIIKQDDEGEEI